MSSVEIDTARSQWEAGHRRLRDTRGDRARHERLLAQVAAVTDELRRRLGETFTLSDLTREYARAERWSRDAAASAVPDDAKLQDIALVEDAAFHLYARAAVDFAP